MIPRYTRPKIEKIWSPENKFAIWTEIECLIAEKLSINGTIPKKAANEIRKKAKFNVKEIELIEKKTKHISINVISLYKIDPAINEIYVIPANNLVKKLFITYY